MMAEGYASEWFATTDSVATEMRAAARRSRLGSPQRLHHHPYGQPCNERCEDVLGAETVRS